MVQAIGNTQLGGVQSGLLRDAYHSPGRKCVPDHAVATTSTAKTKNDRNFVKILHSICSSAKEAAPV